MASTHIARITAGGVSNRAIAPSIYYTCSTAAATAAKTITTNSTNKWTSADLFEGLTIFVKFTNNNTSTNPTLNIDSIGAKPIYRYGTTVPSTSAEGSWNANSVVGLTYDTTLNSGGCWVMHDWNNTTYSALSQSDATAGTSTTGRLITAKVLNDTIDGKISNLGGGTVTSITLKAGNGISLDTDNTAITTSGSRTISHADTSSQASSSNSGRTYIQSVTLDDYGHVTGLSTATESVSNTDTKVTQSVSTSSTEIPVLLRDNKNASTDAGTADAARFVSAVTVQPSTGNLKATKFNGYILAAASAKAVDTSISAGSSSANLPTSAAVAAFVEGKGYITSADIPEGASAYTGTISAVGTTASTGSNNGFARGDHVHNITSSTITSALGYTPGTSNLALGNTASDAAAGNHSHGNITNGGDITATAPTIANGDQIIINDNSVSKITNGPTFDGSTTTTALTPKGTWETFSKFSGSYNDLSDKPTIPTNTDTKLQVAEITSGTTYYPIVGTGTTAATRQYDTTGLKYISTNGTTSQLGKATLTLGNSTTAGTTNNKNGELALYGASQYYTTLKSYDLTTQPTANRTIILPDKSGTVALTSDIPDTSSFIITETDPVFSASAAAGISSTDISNWNAKVSDDKTWNGVELAKQSTTNSGDSTYVPLATSTSPINMSFTPVKKTPTANAIAKYDASAYLYSTTPSADDNSTKVATAAYVNNAISNAEEISISSTEPAGSNTKIWIRI